MRQYWWGVEKGKVKMSWLCWDRMRLPRSKAGMGFRDMRAFNKSLLARQAWRLIDSPDSLCILLLRARYYPCGNLVTNMAFSSNASAMWKGIEHGLDPVENRD